MNFAFVACTVALWGLEYLLGLEDITQRGQRGATAGQPPVQDGAQTRGDSRPPPTPTDQAAPNYSNRLPLCVLEQKKKGGNPLDRWAKATPFTSQAIIQLGSQKENGNI